MCTSVLKSVPKYNAQQDLLNLLGVILEVSKFQKECLMSNLTRFDRDGIELVINTQTGESYASVSGYARMAGKDKSTISRRTVAESGVLMAEIQTPGGLQGVALIPESLICQWLPNDNPDMAAKMMRLGVRVFMHEIAGYRVTSKAVAPPALTKRELSEAELEIEKIKALGQINPGVAIAYLKKETAEIYLERSRVIREKPPVAPIPASAPVDPMEKLKQDIAVFREQFKEKNGRYPRVREIQQKFGGRRIWKGNTRARVTADVVRAIMG